MAGEYLEAVASFASLEELVRRAAGGVSLVVSLDGRLLPLASLLGRSTGGTPVVLTAARPGVERALREAARGRYLVVRGEMLAATPRSVFVYLARRGLVEPSLAVAEVAAAGAPSVAPNTSVKKAVSLLEESGAIAVGVRSRGRISKVLTVVDFAGYALEAGLSRRDLLLDPTPVSRVDPVVVGDPADLRSGFLDGVSRYSMAVVELGCEVLVDESSLRKYLAARVVTGRK
ncbi:hypothetical protein [Thermofilum pendens]|uniref:hypothetical protein n=1 Tax=Thermofilum pendens TaxID=2269 RepID=UPI000AD84914|nr:hypothetical protein [Thermofilum pendens]